MATKKLYVEMAKTIKRHVDDSIQSYGYVHTEISSLVDDLCGDLKQDNMRFNQAKFLDACGLLAP